MNDRNALPNALIAAIESGDTASVRRLLPVSDINAVDARPLVGCGYTLLHYAVDADHLDAIRLLVDAGAMIDAQDATGATPLWRACNGGRLSAANILLAAGANPNTRNHDGYSCLGRANQVELADLLRTYGGEL